MSVMGWFNSNFNCIKEKYSVNLQLFHPNLTEFGKFHDKMKRAVCKMFEQAHLWKRFKRGMDLNMM